MNLRSLRLAINLEHLGLLFYTLFLFFRSISTTVLQHLMPRALPHRIILLMLITTMMKKMAGKCQTFIMTRKFKKFRGRIPRGESWGENHDT